MKEQTYHRLNRAVVIAVAVEAIVVVVLMLTWVLTANTEQFWRQPYVIVGLVAAVICGVFAVAGIEVLRRAGR